MAESKPPPKRKRGRPAKFVEDYEGNPIVGLSLHKADVRYYATGSKPTRYFGTNYDEAIVKFREWQARQRKEYVTLPAERPAGSFKGKDFRVGEPHVYADIPTESYSASVLDADFWAKVSWAIRQHPHLAAEKTGLPLDRLHQFKAPEKSLPLSEIGQAYIDRPEQMSYQYSHDTKRQWGEFLDVVGKTATVADVSAADVRKIRYALITRRRMSSSVPAANTSKVIATKPHSETVGM